MKVHHGAVSAGGREEESERIDRSGDHRQATGAVLRPEKGLTPEDAEPLDVTIDENANDPPGPVADPALLSLISDGFFVLGHVPYGMKTVRERHRRARTNKWVTHTRLEPGDRQEVRIVRLIYELYACQNMPVNHILNNLRAQNIPTRRGAAAWTLTKIDRLLIDPIYIGATRYKGVVRYGAFPPVIEPWIFYAAQSRRHFEKLSKYGSLVQQGIFEPVEGEIDE